MVVGAGAAGASAVLAAGSLWRFEDYWSAPLGRDAAELDAWVVVDDVRVTVSGVTALLIAAGLVVLAVWMTQAARRAEWMAPGPRTWSSGWAVAGWFVPVANMVIPRLVLNEIESRPTADGPARPLQLLGQVWWWLAMGSLVLLAIGGVVVGNALDAFFIDSPGALRQGYLLLALGLLGGAVASVLGAVYIGRVQRDLVTSGDES